jgi:predicted nucleic acid-binding protein
VVIHDGMCGEEPDWFASKAGGSKQHEYGMEAKNWGTRRRELRFLSRFKPLLPDIDTANQWARIKSGPEKKGRPISFPDAWIAASALH